ncbi:MAG: membrane protein insertase YidC [Lachnospiraceae bacterium]|nr:membrane protein insertase YidC [Lachnospiraceae bacterium]
MTEALYHIIISPVHLLIETVFDVLYDLIGNAGLAIVAVSLVVNVLVLPLYLRADRVQEAERAKQRRMAPGIAHIRKTFRGDEQFMMLSTYYRQNSYSPLHGLRGAFSLLLQIPFFIAAYRFLSGLALLRGTSFLMIPDLGAPDGLLAAGALRVNLLPVLMTLLNVLSTFVYTRGAVLKEKLQAYGLAALFLVLLYESPAGLVLYWTCNQVFSLLKNLVNTGGRFFCIHFEKKTEKTAKRAKMNTKEPSPRIHLAAALALTLLAGALIPSALIADSPLEFTGVRDALNPARYVFSTFCIAAGCFLLWGGVFYVIASAKGKRLLTTIFTALSAVAILNYMAFGKSPGVLSGDLTFDRAVTFPLSLTLLNAAAVILVIAAVILLIRFKPGIASAALTVCCVAFVVMTVLNLRNITNESCAFTQAPANRESVTAPEGIRPVIPLSREGRNVVVLMLDRAISGYIPYIMQEKPELEKQFAGFVYYPNTLSHGSYTVFGAPALFGGYEYTVAEMNRRADERLVVKHNEALKVLPKLFSEEGYDVTVCDPPFAGYRWIPDLSIYDDMPGVRAHLTDGVYTETLSGTFDKPREENRKRNLFCYSLFKSSPLFLQPAVYAEGTYHSTYADEAFPELFLNAYSVLANMMPLTEITDDTENRFVMMSNATPHEPAMLTPPDYTLTPGGDTPHGSDPRFVLSDGSRVRMDDTWGLQHYHVNMASLLRIGEWLDYLREEGVYDNTRIIIASDHGRFLGQFDRLIIDNELDAEAVNALLLVKDFGSDAPLATSMDFMTNADVPFLAANGAVKSPVNPFSGKPLDGRERKKEKQLVTSSDNWRTTNQHGNTFDTSDGHWYTVHDNIFQKENWERVE